MKYTKTLVIACNLALLTTGAFAQSETQGMVKMPVKIETGRTTVLHLGRTQD